MLSCRAADADAGASGIAATVGAATHTLPVPFPTHCPFALRSLRPLYPFRKAASLAVGATHTPLTALHNACNPPHPPSHPPTNRLPFALHPPLFAASSSTPRSSLATLPLRPSSTGYDIPHTRSHTHIYTYISLPFPARTYTQSVPSNTHVSALSSGRFAASPLSLPLSFLFSFPISFPPTPLGLSWSLQYSPSLSPSRSLPRPHLPAPFVSLSCSLPHASFPCSRKPRTYGPRNRTPNIEPLSPTSPNAFRECGPVRYPSHCLPACLPVCLRARIFERPRTRPTNQVGNRKFASRREVRFRSRDYSRGYSHFYKQLKNNRCSCISTFCFLI